MVNEWSERRHTMYRVTLKFTGEWIVTACKPVNEHASRVIRVVRKGGADKSRMRLEMLSPYYYSKGYRPLPTNILKYHQFYQNYSQRQP